jgi:hypothetical protein
MVDIVIGGVQPACPPVGKPGTTGGALEAVVLNVRPARRGISGPAGRERRKIQRRDPPSGKVLTIMVPNGTNLPENLTSQSHKVLLRFIKNR